MSQSLSNLIVHLVYSTKLRERALPPSIRDSLQAYMVGIFNNLDCPSLITRAVEDHVHSLFVLSKNVSLSHVVEEVKRGSSLWLKTQHPRYQNFHWQAGYGAFSVSESHVEDVIIYIKNQAEHHKRVSFQDEYRRFLEKYKVTYDERYVWD